MRLLARRKQPWRAVQIHAALAQRFAVIGEIDQRYVKAIAIAFQQINRVAHHRIGIEQRIIIGVDQRLMIAILNLVAVAGRRKLTHRRG